MRTCLRLTRILLLGLWSMAAAAAAGDEPPAVAEEPGIEIDSHVFGAQSARALGPAVMGGRITALDVVDGDPRVLWVGAAGGGVWKSRDGGVTFEPVFDEHPQDIGAIAIDQARPDTVWVGTGEGWVRNSVGLGAGVFRTTDGGRTWQCLGLEDSERIARILLHPENPDVAWVAAMGPLWSAGETRGVYRTDDGGRTWRRLLYVDDATGCCDLAMDPQEPDILYAALWQFRRRADFFTSGGPGSGLYKSTDGGLTWRELREGLPAGELGRIAIALAPSRPSRLYATIEAAKTALYRSDDAGATWQRLADGQGVKERPFYFSLLVCDPTDHERFYKTASALWTSGDGGRTFSALGGRVHPDYHALWIDPADPQHLVCGTDGGLYRSWNRGGSWVHLANLPIAQFYHVAVDARQPYWVYGGLQDNGSWCAPTRSTGGIENGDWVNLGGGDGFAVQPDPQDCDLVYFEWQGGNITRAHLDTGESKDIRPLPARGEPTYRFNWNTPLALSPTVPERLYAGSQFVHRTIDRGETWQRLSPDLTTDDPARQRQAESGGLTVDNTTAENHCTVVALAESPLDPALIWAGTDDGNLQVTDDDGTAWRRVNPPADVMPAGTWIAHVEPSGHARGTCFAVGDGHRGGDRAPYVLVTDDLGASWRNLATDAVRGPARVVRQDPVNPDLLYLGTEFGLYLTLDRGRHWARFTEIPPVAVHDLAIQAAASALVVGTHGRGLYVIDDLAPLRQFTREALEKELFLFASAPTIIATPAYKAHSPGDLHFAAANPLPDARIIYHLKSRHLFGDLKVDLYSPAGELIKTLPGGKRKGINVVTWGLRLPPPQVPPSPTLDPRLSFAALYGPVAPEGEYRYVITKGQNTWEGSLRVAYDPDSPHTPADRALQQDAVQQLYALQARLAWLGAAVSELREAAEQRSAGLAEKDRLRRGLQELGGELDAFESRIMAARQVQGIAGVKKLREDVLDLYGSVSSYGGRPGAGQLERLEQFAAEIDAAAAELAALAARRLPELNRRLQAQSLAPLALLEETEFAAREP